METDVVYDVGSEFLKVFLNIIEKVAECKINNKSFSYEGGIGNEKHKDRGINKLFIIV